MKNNRVCIVCYAQYSYCNNCKEHMHFPTWMNIYHSENCRNIFNIISSYLGQKITKEEAKKRLDSCDLTYKDNLKETIKNAIDEIYYVKADNVDVLNSEMVNIDVVPTDVSKKTRAKVRVSKSNNDSNLVFEQ